jgi:hypothetical protein
MKRRLSDLLSPEWLAIAVAAVLVGWILFIPPVVGVADNGDFQRIMGTVGLDYVDPAESFKDRFFRYMHTKYQLHGLGAGGYVSSEIAVVMAAALLNRIFYSSHLFDIRFLGAVYALLFLAAMHCLLRSYRGTLGGARWILAAAFVFVFADVGYTAYYNSLFGEPVSFVFMLFTVGFALYASRVERPGIGLLVAYFTAAAFLAGAKVQTAPVGLILVLLGLRFRQLREDPAWRKTWLGMSVFVVVFSAAIYLSAPKELKVINEYQSVFNGVLKDSPTPARDLQELGISPELAVLAGTNYFTPNTPIKQQDPRMKELFYEKISHSDIVLFYMRHPLRFLDKLQQAAHNAMMIRPYYLGNYEKSAGFDPGRLSMSFALWSEFKKNVLPNSLAALAAFFAACTFVLIVYWRKASTAAAKLAVETFFMIELAALISLVVPVLGDGLTDIGKHLFLFNVCFDLMFVAGVTWVAHLAVKWSSSVFNLRIQPKEVS